MQIFPIVRIILSRKGFDSQYGGNDSPILPDGTMVSLPIPELGSGVAYSQLGTAAGTMYDLMRQLGIARYKEKKQWRPLTTDSEAHLDPDLCREVRPRSSDWRPVFGQCEGQQTHLNGQGVCQGDLFLFYGRFRQTERFRGRLSFCGDSIHVIFGYMQVGAVVSVDQTTWLPWCAEHPHLVNRNRKNNALYIAASSLAGSKRPGAAVLPFSTRRVLSAKPGLVSKWRLPAFFHPEECGRILTNHKLHMYERDGEYTLLATKTPGQEYVIDATPQIEQWAYDMISAAT